MRYTEIKCTKFIHVGCYSGLEIPETRPSNHTPQYTVLTASSNLQKEAVPTTLGVFDNETL